MLCVDVNVLVDAHRIEQPGHQRTLEWLEDARRRPEPLGIPRVAASGFLRIVTHPRIFRDPSPIGVAVGFIDHLLATPSVMALAPGTRHWEIFSTICRDLDLHGNDVPDAYLAAIALEQGATFVTRDGGFKRFDGLRVERPGDG